MQKIGNGITRVEDYVFSYLIGRNQNLVYVLKLCIIFFFGTLIPGYLFMIIEGKAETELEPYDITEDRRELMKFFKNLSNTSKNEREFKEKAAIKIEEYRELVIVHQQTKTFVKNHKGYTLWTLWNSIVYASTVYTTLGYGELTPKTYAGRTLTIIYALVGIPLFLIALTDFGRFITLILKYLWSYVRRLYYTGNCRKRKKGNKEIHPIFRESLKLEDKLHNIPLDLISTTGLTEETPSSRSLSTFDEKGEFTLPISLSILIFSVYMFLSGLVYCYWEGWSFFESFYFVFISVSTVGFGDLIPHEHFAQTISIFIIFFGLALCTMCIEVIQARISASFLENDYGTDFPDYYGPDEESGPSLENLDILDFERDESVERILQIEEEEEARLGIIRPKSMAFIGWSRLDQLRVPNEEAKLDVGASGELKKEFNQEDSVMVEKSVDMNNDNNTEIEELPEK